MCGICGIYNLNHEPIDKLSFVKMADVIRHRGPDDEGFVMIETSTNTINPCYGKDTILPLKQSLKSVIEAEPANLGMGFRRLSIIDLSELGHQPLCDVEEKCWIIFNGEIYNYLEIREELQKKGYRFKSQTDTEVIINAYLYWGTDCVSHFNGMFAFAIWDKQNQKLFCARDRMGVKPFYYTLQGKSFIWASEIKQFLESGLVEREVNYDNVHAFLQMGRLNIDKSTFIKDILELPPAHTAIVSESGIEIKRYWDINPENRVINLSDDEYAEQLKLLFQDAVKIRLRSDVPLGVALSGGIDSSSIACLADRVVKNPIKTFSVYYTDDRKYDEREYIEEVLRNGNFYPVYFTANQNITMDELRKWQYFQDEPCMSASPYSSYKNNQNIRNSGIIVALNGQGGDELFAGYHTYFKYYYLDLLKNMRFGKFLSDYRSYSKEFHSSFADMASLFSKIISRMFISDKTLKKLEYLEVSNAEMYSQSVREYSPVINLKKKFKNSLEDNLYHTLVNTSIPHLLHWEDRNSMAWSVESRVPFLDYRLIEWAFSIPMNQKIRGPKTKYVLRNSMKGILPEKIRNRMDKVGFATPTDLWTSKLLKNDILDMFASDSFRKRDLFNADKIMEAYRKNPSVFKQNELWRIFSVEMWFRIFIDQTNL